MRKFHILSSVALAFSLFFTLGSAATQAQDGSEFAGGNGTEANPWQIATKQQLAAINNYTGDASKGKYFILTKDLEFTAEDFSAFGDFYNDGQLWIPLCPDYWSGFLGNFDGGNHEIRGLKSNYVETYEGDVSGLFYRLNNASVKNVKVTYGNISVKRFGGISIICSGSVIDNCHVSGDFSTSGAGNDNYFGGIIGACSENAPNYVINCSFKGNVTASGYVYSTYTNGVGGIAGSFMRWCNLVIADSFVEANIDGDARCIGGMIGEGKGVIQNCYVKGNISGTTYVGGFIGSTLTESGQEISTVVSQSYFSGIITGGIYVGGLIGIGCGTDNYVGSVRITESYSEGEIRVNGNNGNSEYSGIAVGGLIGFNYSSLSAIADSYSHCNISGSSRDSVSIGGLVGCCRGHDVSILRSYAKGEIKGDQSVQASVSGKHAYLGGLVGYRYVTEWLIAHGRDGNLSILKSVGMNPSLIAPHGDKEDTGRIIGGFDKCNLGNNYALDTMMLKISNKDVTVTGTANDKNGQDKSASILAQKSTYTGLDWDFDNIWKMSVNGYPIFIWQEDTPIATAPTITSQPVSQTVNVGSSVTFSVTATGTEPLNYQWYKDSTPINGATGSSYAIGSAKTSDEGSYFVIVSNSVGNAVSSVATLTVIESPKAPVIIVHPASQTVDVGQQVTFSVVATGTEPLNYQWLKNGATIPGATKASYTISSAKMEDAGNYMVIVSNSAGVAVSNSATLTVKDPAVPPVIVVQPMSQEVLIGESVTFSVVATGTEPLSYQWLFNGNPIPGATGATYYIGQVTEAHEGNYSVIVSNVAGTVVSSTAVLTVKILPPVIVMHPQTQIIMKGSTATFAVIAEGYGLSYQWTFNGKDIAGANQSVYMIPAAEAGNVGSYAVKVSNKAGSVTSQSAMLWLNNLQMYAGVEVYGPIGAKFTVWYKDDAESGEWKKLTSSTVSASPTVVIDYDSPQNKKRFYKVEIE